MKRIVALFALSVLVATLSGCVTPHAYVDPQYQKASFDSIQRPAQPVPVKVEVHFQRNGAAYDKVDKTLQADVEQSLKKVTLILAESFPFILRLKGSRVELSEKCSGKRLINTRIH